MLAFYSDFAIRTKEELLVFLLQYKNYKQHALTQQWSDITIEGFSLICFQRREQIILLHRV